MKSSIANVGTPGDALDVDLPTTSLSAGRGRWRGLDLSWPDGVLPPWYSTEAVVRAFDRWAEALPGGVVADVGCGSGALGLLLARRGFGRVVLVDRDGRAVRAACVNRRANGLEQSTAVVCGDGLGWVGPVSTFDVVVVNLPFDPSPPPAGADPFAPVAGSFRDTGHRGLRRVLGQVGDRLLPGGFVVLASSPTIGDAALLADVVDSCPLRPWASCTWWFSTPRANAPDAVNAYRVDLLISR